MIEYARVTLDDGEQRLVFFCPLAIALAGVKVIYPNAVRVEPFSKERFMEEAGRLAA